MTKRYFKTKERIKKQYASQSAANKAKVRERREAFLKSPEYAEAMERINAAKHLSESLATKAMVHIHANPKIAEAKQIKQELSDMTQSLVDKMMKKKISGI